MREVNKALLGAFFILVHFGTFAQNEDLKEAFEKILLREDIASLMTQKLKDKKYIFLHSLCPANTEQYNLINPGNIVSLFVTNGYEVVCFTDALQLELVLVNQNKENPLIRGVTFSRITKFKKKDGFMKLNLAVRYTRGFDSASPVQFHIKCTLKKEQQKWEIVNVKRSSGV